MKRFITGLTAAVMLTATAVPVSADSVSACPLKTPQIVSTAKTYESVTLRWNRITGASGYKVYKKVGSKYKVCGTVRDGAKVKFKITKLKSSKKYTFKVRAYKKADGKTCFSKYSKAKSVTTKADDRRTAEVEFFTLKYSNDDFIPAIYDIHDCCEVSLIYRNDTDFNLDVMYLPDRSEGMTSKELAQQFIDQFTAPGQAGHSGFHAEIVGRQKIAGLDGVTVRAWGDDSSAMANCVDYFTFCANGNDVLRVSKNCFDITAEDTFTAKADKVIATIRLK